jgi:hypothetical protein
MKTFLFVTTLTPKKILSPLRRALFELYLESLKKQTYTNWIAILVGEEDRRDGNFIYLNSPADSKSDKLKVAYEYILKMEIKPDFIIRLDDDDLISPFVLERAVSLDFDCYSDRYHSFYDLTSSRTSQQIRNWLPNTVIHKYEHAMAKYGSEDIPLFTQSHNIAWHEYYIDKKVVFASKKETIYLRVISSTTITSKMEAAMAEDIASVDMAAFQKYLNTFGRWSYFACPDFKIHLLALIKVWEDFSKLKIDQKRSSLFDFFKK